jgi:hypothetical protein
MADVEHQLIHMTSHVTSLGGRVGVVGLCSCGWLGGEEGDDTKSAVDRLYEAWETHEPAGRLRWTPSAKRPSASGS